MNNVSKDNFPLQISAEHIIFENANRSGIITLNRPKARNALTLEMLEPIKEHFKNWAKDPHIYGVVIESTQDTAFCAGGDIRQIRDKLMQTTEEALHYFKTEYETNGSLNGFLKPTIPLIDGIVMGGGIGLSAYGTHMIMAENTRFAMPEVSIGLFPDVGTNFLLSRLPAYVGFYLALTGRSITAADCFAYDIASHTVLRRDFPLIRAAMIEADPIDTILAPLQQDFGPSELKALEPVIEKIFSAPRVEDIYVKLEEEMGNTNSQYRSWAKETLGDMRQKSPLSLKVTLRLLQEGKNCETLNQSLEMDYNLMTRFLDESDFAEGVRALLIDKDNSPNWKHKSIEDVSDTLIDSYFSSHEHNILNFVEYNAIT